MLAPCANNRVDTRRRALLASALVATALPMGQPARAAAAETLRIGYQKSSTLAIWLKGKGQLEKALAPLNVVPSWHEFTSGLPLLEALNVGALDLTADVADAVPPFALAAGARISYVAIEAPSPHAQAIVVKADSPIRSVAQLKGRKVAFAKGAGAHFLLLQALQRATRCCRWMRKAWLNSSALPTPSAVRPSSRARWWWPTPRCGGRCELPGARPDRDASPPHISKRGLLRWRRGDGCLSSRQRSVAGPATAPASARVRWPARRSICKACLLALGGVACRQLGFQSWRAGCWQPRHRLLRGGRCRAAFFLEGIANAGWKPQA
jgi:hypothetical protein